MKKKTKKKSNHKYFFSVVEEAIMNKDYFGYRGGRIEIHREDQPYAVDEVRFFIPEKFMEDFRKLFDFKTTDKKIFHIGEIDLEKYNNI